MGIIFKCVISLLLTIGLSSLLVDAANHEKKISTTMIVAFFTVLVYNVIK